MLVWCLKLLVDMSVTVTPVLQHYVSTYICMKRTSSNVLEKICPVWYLL